MKRREFITLLGGAREGTAEVGAATFFALPPPRRMMYFVRSCLLTEMPSFPFGDNGQQECRRRAPYSNDPTSLLSVFLIPMVEMSLVSAVSPVTNDFDFVI
jgi:hypothetical protein